MKTKIKKKKLEIMHSQAKVSLMVPMIVATSITYAFRDQLSVASALACILLLSFVTVIRLHTANLFLKSMQSINNIDYWYFLHIFGVILSGVIWGGFILVLARSSDTTNISITAICATGMCAGAMAVYAYSFASFVSFVFPLLTPLAVFFAFGEQPADVSIMYGPLSYFIFLYLAAITYASWKLNKVTEQTLYTQIEKEDSVDELLEQTKTIVDNNKKLEENIRHHEELEESLLKESQELKTLSAVDSLTGISNRRRFDEALYDEWHRASRVDSPISLIMCDIDHFKEYNDSHGHLEGDKCLSRIAHLLEDYARRAGDMAARYGGEEFAIILPDTNSEVALKIAEQIRVAIEDLDLSHASSSVSDVVTASFGVCTTVPIKENPPESLVACADRALYGAKHQGKNKVVVEEYICR